jgi:endo-beta-N-acetylglucosaminidase D
MPELPAINRRRLLTMAGVAGAAAVLGTRLAASGATPAAPNLPAGVPTLHGYDAPAIKAWTPQTDPFAKYFRSQVPLAKRIHAFAPTQANPALSPSPQLLSLSNDYVEPNNKFVMHPYGDGFNAYALRFWQYLDTFGSWHGLPLYGQSTAPTPHFGVVNPPNPAWTDAAHRNGVLSLGAWFWPRDPDTFAPLVERKPDGSFPVADKLIAMAVYFGFDGYFINQEGDVDPAQARLLQEMLGYLTRTAPKGFYVQWYDAMLLDGDVDYQNEFNAKNSPWIIDHKKRVCDSIFLNYDWSQTLLQDSHDHAVSLGLDPLRTVYAGTELAMNMFSQPEDPRWIFPPGKPVRTSWALFGTQFPFTLAPGDKNTVEGQKQAYVYERQLWSGPRQDPAHPGRELPPIDGDHANPKRWDGVAYSIVEKSTAGSYPFVTRFNTGTGQRFFVNGQLVGTQPWFNIAIQDLLPTWQWWVRKADGSAYGGLHADYDYDLAYDGGTSLVVSGALTAGTAVELRLFKTWLPAGRDIELFLTYTTGRANAPSHLRVGLTFADRPTEVTWVEVGTTTSSGWNQFGLPIGRYAGRTIAAISLGFLSPAAVSDYTVHIGALSLSDGRREVPPTPRGLTIDGTHIAGGTATVYLSWTLSRDNVAYYDVFRGATGAGAGYRAAAREWVGRIFGDAFVVPGLKRNGSEATTGIELVAVSPLGVASEAARTRFSWTA